MPTERFVCLAAGVGIMLAVLFDKVEHAGWMSAAVFALITALLWIGTEGRAPVAVLAAVIAFGAIHEMHHMVLPGRSAELLNFFADTAAALAAAAVLFAKGKRVCAESLEQ